MTAEATRSSIARAAALLAGLIGLSVVAGWVLDVSWIKSVLPDAVGMAANTATALLLASASLFISASGARPRLKGLAFALALAAMLLGLGTASQSALGWELGIDQLLAADTTDCFRAAPGRMSPLSATALGALGIALAALSLDRFKPLVWLMAGIGTTIGMVGLLGYMWHADELVTNRLMTPMAVHTALACTLLGAGIWFASRASSGLPVPAALTRASIEFKVAGGFSAAFLLLIIGGGITYRAGAESARSAEALAHVHEVRAHVWQLYAGVADAEAVALAYLLTGSAQRKEDFARFEQRSHQHALTLRTLVAYDDASKDILNRLVELEAQRLTGLRRAMARYDSLGYLTVAPPGVLEEATRIMDTLRALTNEIDDDQAVMLVQSRARARETQRNALLFLLLTVLGVAATFVILSHNIRREMFARAAADARMRELNADLERRVKDRTADLELNRRRLADLFEFSNSALVAADGDGIVQQLNRQAEVLFGWTRAELLGQPLALLFPPGPPAAEQAAGKSFLDALSLRATGVGDNKLSGVRKDGSFFPADLNLSPVHTGGGLVVVASIRDDTERERMTAALRESEALYRHTLDHMLEGCHVVDFDWRCLYVNAAAALQSRLSIESILGRVITEVVPGIEKTELFVVYRRSMEDRTEQHAQVEYEFPDGSIVWFELTVLPVPGGISIFSVDITARKQAEREIGAINADLERRVLGRTSELVLAREAAEAANRAKSAFLATMSHEIRTPMNGVIGMVEVLFHSGLPEHQADAVRTIRASAFSLLAIIDDILDFSKIEAGRLELERSPVALPGLIEDACDTLVPMALEKHVDLSLFVSPQVPECVWSDPTRLRQVLFNLAGNAIKFSAGRAQRRGSVSIRVEATGHAPPRLMLRFADNGIGMAPETLAQVFSSFTQAEASTTRRFGGTGLGLTICKRLVELMDGGLEVQSVVGEGSVFTVELPMEVVSGSTPAPEPDLRKLDCILVGSQEGSQDTTDDLRVYLAHAGATVHQVADLPSAVRRAAGMRGPVVIHNAWQSGTPAGQLQDAFPANADVRHLLIVRGRRRGAWIAASDVVTLDGNCLRRSVLLRAVAVAAGRESPEVLHDSGVDDLGSERGEPPTVTEARLQSRLILIAEDDEVNQKVILRQIEMLGYAAEIANNGAEALRLWLAGPYALLLTDLHMPDMDGYTLAETIRRHEAGRSPPAPERMPILALTANALRGEAVRATAAGMDEYLTKPLQLHLLQAALTRWLPHPPRDSVPAELPPEAGDSSAGLAIDVRVLKSLIGDDPEVVREVLESHIEQARQAALELSAASAADDIRQIAAIAHKLKSSSRSVGAVALGDVCAELENACRAGTREGIAQCMLDFDTAMAAIEAHAF